MDVVKGRPPLDYNEYGDLLLAAAVQRDKKLKLPGNRRDRVVQNTENKYDDIDDHSARLNDDHLDELYTVLQAYRQQRSNRVFLPKHIWDTLAEEQQESIKAWNAEKKMEEKGERRSPPNQRNVNNHGVLYPSFDDDKSNDRDTHNDASTGQVENSSEIYLQDNISNNIDCTDLIAHLTKRSSLPANHKLRALLASSHKTGEVANTGEDQRSTQLHQRPPTSTSGGDRESVVIDGKRYIQADTHHIEYRVAANAATTQHQISSLIDRGANGGLAGQDVRLIEKTLRCADVSGINNHTLKSLPIATVAGVVQTHIGPVCLIMHQYAYLGTGKTIHSSVQIEQFGSEVNDKSLKIKGGKQSITTIDGYVIPLQIRGGLAHMDMHPPSNDEFEELPHVFLTSDEEWDPHTMDNELNLDEWLDARMEANDLPGINEYGDNRFDAQGYYNGNRELRIDSLFFFDANEEFPIETLEDVIDSIKYSTNFNDVNSNVPQFDLLRPLFAYAPADVIKRTWDVSTRYARYIERYSFKKHFKSRFPAANVPRRHEPVASDTVYSDTPAIDDGSTSAQIFVGTESLLTDVYGMKTDKEFVNSLGDNIRRRGAMDKLITDQAQVEISKKVLDILRSLVIDDWQSEPYHEHQNFAERRIQTIKKYTNKVLDRTGAPPFCWLLAIAYTCFILNHLATESLKWKTPWQVFSGVPSDISPIITFAFWEPVYFATADFLKYEGKPRFPSETSEGKGRFVGFGESVGDVMTFKILTDDTSKIIYRSCVRSALTEQEINKRLSRSEGEDDTKPIKEIVKSPESIGEGESKRTSTFVIEPQEILNRTYLTEPDEHGQRFRAKVVRKIEESDKALQEHPDKIKFLVSIEGDRADEIIAYDDILNFLEEEILESDKYWKFKDIIAHEGPLKPHDPSYKGSLYNVLVEWEDGSKTFEPLTTIGADSPVVCAMYGKRM